MSLIKSGNLADLAAVRPIGSEVVVSAARTVRPQDEELERLRRLIASFESQLRERDIALDVLRKDVERAFEDGKEKGRATGLAEAEDRENERLALLERSARQAHGVLSESLGSLERLSAVLSRECIEKILGDASDRVDLIARIIAHQMERIDRAMLVNVEVSSKDFSNPDALAVIGARLAPLRVFVSANDELPAGGCVMILRLGRIVVGLDQQWAALRDILGDMALPETPP